MSRSVAVRSFAVCLLFLFLTAWAAAQEAPKSSMLEHAAKLKPVQSDVEIDVPAAEEIARCELVVSEDNRVMKILSPQKIVLRVFSDTNGDPKRQVDQWSYFESGVEVYRELDTDGNGKQDQFRWLNSAGTRWGIDQNEDGVIDYWKEISAEECSREIILALTTKDQNRFLRAALSEAEMKDLALGETHSTAVAQKVAALKTGFAAAAAAVNLKGDSEWVQLNALLPGIVPSGEQGNKKDVHVYENAAATVSEAGKARQISLGTLVKIGDNNWRVLDLPKPYDDNTAVYTFIQPAVSGASGTAETEIVTLMNQIQTLQTQIPTLPAAQRPAKHEQVVALLLEIVKKSTAQEERDNWIRQLADMIMEATGRGEYPKGKEQIATVFTSVNKAGMEELAAHVRSRQIMTEYYVSLAAGTEQMKAYHQWLADLEAMAEQYGKTESGREAMMQLASYKETAEGGNEDSMKWYTKVAEAAAGQPMGVKAKGAIRRLTAKGKAVPFRATDTAGKIFDITDYKGKWVLLVFWDANSAAQLPIIKAVTDKFEASGLAAVGVNLDADAATLRNSLKSAPAWRQLYAADGLDGAIAAYWGIMAPPYMILYNKEGMVISIGVPSAENLQKTLTDLTKETK